MKHCVIEEKETHSSKIKCPGSPQLKKKKLKKKVQVD